MQIYNVDAAPGVLGISAMPGLANGLKADVQVIAAWGAGLVLTMTAQGEMERQGFTGFDRLLSSHGIAWRHLPIADFGAPPPDTQALWPAAAADAHAILDAGGRVLTHCRGGCGRSGMAALRLLAERGADPQSALDQIRQTRPCAVETQAQYAWAASAG